MTREPSPDRRFPRVFASRALTTAFRPSLLDVHPTLLPSNHLRATIGKADLAELHFCLPHPANTRQSLTTSRPRSNQAANPTNPENGVGGGT